MHACFQNLSIKNLIIYPKNWVLKRKFLVFIEIVELSIFVKQSKKKQKTVALKQNNCYYLTCS